MVILLDTPFGHQTAPFKATKSVIERSLLQARAERRVAESRKKAVVGYP